MDDDDRPRGPRPADPLPHRGQPGALPGTRRRPARSAEGRRRRGGRPGGAGAAERLGEHHVVVLGHPEYYPRFGASAEASAHGIGLTIDVPDEALMALTLDAAHPLPAGTVRYAAPFGI